jgi:hypothetical protein
VANEHQAEQAPGESGADGGRLRLNHLNSTVTDVPAAARFLETYFAFTVEVLAE